MLPAEDIDRLADAVARKLAPNLARAMVAARITNLEKGQRADTSKDVSVTQEDAAAAPIRLNRRNMAKAIDVSPRTLQAWTNRPDDPCPCTRIDSLVLYNPSLVGEWLSRQTKSPAGRPGGGKDQSYAAS